jgi:acetylornithine deacetylase/succinyl-diaminopimelate desuccinylase-like protein
MHSLEALAKDYQQNRETILKEFFTFLRFQSVSSEPQFKGELLACADWVKKYLLELGFTVETWPTKGHPVIFASYLKAGPNKPTLLIYNHYDVQPVDPLEAWETPPFEPTVRNGEIFARGAQDNKGQCFYVLQALKALIKRDGTLPLNIKLCIEGEEEMGSVGLSSILKEKAAQLKADYLAVVDMGIPAPETPAVTIGVRGLVTLEVSVEGSNTDMHSGSHGGVVFNPIHALVEMLSKLRDAKGRVTIPGFYDQVKEVSAAEKASLSLQFSAEEYRQEFGAEASGGEQGYSPNERAWLRPTVEVNGITGGYAGPGFKTVIPAKASAKLSCRLVPDQQPEKIGQLVAQFLRDNAPAGVKVEVQALPGCGIAARSEPTSKVVQAFADAYTEVFKKPCQRILGGGSIPVVAELTKVSQSEMVLLGMGLASDKIHAPNEHFGIDRLERGYLVVARAIEILATF